MSDPNGQKIAENQGENTNSGEQKAKDSPTELKNIVAEFAQKNRTLFCICLAFSIWFYHGMFDWSTNFGARVKASSETLFVVQVFLTAFTMSRILVFINITDKILRMPIICDLVFLVGYDDSLAKKAFKKICSEDLFNTKIRDYIINMSSSMTNENIHIMKLKPEDSKKRFYYSVLLYMDYLDTEGSRYHTYTSDQKENIINPYWNTISDDKGRCRYSIKRDSTIQTKGFFYQKIWFPKLKDFYKANKKLTIFLAILVLSLATYAVYCFASRPSKQAEPIERQYITEQLFFLLCQ